MPMEQPWKTSYHKDMTWKSANTTNTDLKKQKDARINVGQICVEAHNHNGYLDITMQS